MTHDPVEMTPEEKGAEDALVEGLKPCARLGEFAIIEIPDLKGEFSPPEKNLLTESPHMG